MRSHRGAAGLGEGVERSIIGTVHGTGEVVSAVPDTVAAGTMAGIKVIVKERFRKQ